MLKRSLLQDLTALIGRVFISIVFIVMGIQTIISYHSMILLLINKSVLSVHWLLVLSIVCQLGAGLLIFLGFLTRLGACLLFVFVLADTFFLHSLWEMQNVEMTNPTRFWMSNWPILGGFLYLMAYGAGGFSFDAIRKKPSSALQTKIH